VGASSFYRRQIDLLEQCAEQRLDQSETGPRLRRASVHGVRPSDHPGWTRASDQAAHDRPAV